jgi:hypothetical protein
MSLSSLIAPLVVQLIGINLSFGISSLIYVIFIISCCLEIPWFLLFSSVLVGFAGGLLWVTQVKKTK